MHSKIEVQDYPISFDYIRGLTDGEGCFTFCSSPKIKNGIKSKELLPTFCIGMSRRDENLLNLVIAKLKLKNHLLIFRRVYRKDGYNRQETVRFMVRDIAQLKNIIIPLFYKKLVGYKRTQFEEWIEKIGNDPMVAERYRFLYLMYKNGFYDRNDSIYSSP